ncbi:hypothetical protein ACFQ9X_45780 [Catenulispora yoronensis]
MSEYGVSRETGADGAAGTGAGTAQARPGADEPWFERSEAGDGAVPAAPRSSASAASNGAGLADGAAKNSDDSLDSDDGLGATADPDDDDREPVEEYLDADPQQWISGLIADLERAEQGIGSGPRDVLMARIKLAQAYSELGDTMQAAPLAVTNVVQARRLFPSSEGMLRQLREFRDAACEAAGWTAAMMRESEEDLADEQPSELVTRQWPAAEAVAEAWPAVGVADDEEPLLGARSRS